MATNPLHIALKRCDLLAVRQLLQQPAVVLEQQINEYDRGGETPLMRALQNRLLSSEIVQLLIDFGANPHQESKDFYGYHRPAVSIAISAGDVKKVELLINAGVEVNYMLSDGSDALLNAVQGRDIVNDVQLLALLSLLLRHNVGVNTVTRHAESALRVLSREGRFDAVSLLLMAGADTSQLNWTALAQAVAMGSIDDVKRCLATQADLEERDWWSRTPYLIAIQAGDIAKAQLLLDAGANPSVAGRCGKQAMVYAISNQHISMLNWLLEHGADIEQIDDFGDTCLIEAVERDNAAAVEVLLRAGANTSTRSKSKMPTALNLVDGSGEQLRKIAPDSSAIHELADLLDELKTLAIGEESAAASKIASTLCSAESVEQSA
jgi:ankyrin repeat protein